MRIALIQDHLRNGGTENQTLHIANGLAKSGLEAHAIIFRQGGVLDEKAASSDFTLHFLNQGLLKTDWFSPGLDSLLKSLKAEAIIPMGRMANCHAGLFSNRKRPYKVIATFRTGKSIPFLQRRALRLADGLIANSHDALERIKRTYGIENPNSSVIYNGCIRDTTSLQSAAPRAVGEPVRLINASMFRPEKKQVRLLRICSQLPAQIDWHLTLAGDGPQRDFCIQEADRLGIRNRIEFPGLLPNPTDLYQSGHIAIHASSKESLPNFLVEAQSFGLPVVAYNVDGVGETFENGKSGFLIDHGNQSEFVEKLQLLIESEDLRRSMSQAAREYAHGHFAPKAQINAYIDLLKQLI